MSGIPIASGFELLANVPLDGRLICNTFSELEDKIASNHIYEGAIVYVKEIETYYFYDGVSPKVFYISNHG